jgi:hypothetical protein
MRVATLMAKFDGCAADAIEAKWAACCSQEGYATGKAYTDLATLKSALKLAEAVSGALAGCFTAQSPTPSE